MSSFIALREKALRTGKKTSQLSTVCETAESSRRLSLQLYHHQKIALAALTSAEQNPTLNGENARRNPGESIRFNSIIYRDPLGSGKTFVILALVLNGMDPATTHQNALTSRQNGTIVRACGRILRPTVIVVSSHTFAQWSENVTGYTSARVMFVSSRADIARLTTVVDTPVINLFDCILVKAMTITLEDGSRANILARVFAITGRNTWNRVVYDDYDTLRLILNTKAIHAMSTIYVSGSANYDRRAGWGMRSRNLSLSQHVGDISESPAVMQYNTVHCGSALIASSMTMPIIEHYSYTHVNPHDTIIEIVNQLDESITEMLNADAFGRAAEMLGIASTSVADIFKRVLDDKFTIHQTSARILEAIATFREQLQPADALGTRPIVVPIPLAEVIRLLTQGKVPGCCWSEEYSAAVSTLETETRTTFVDADKSLARVKDNLKSGECQICYNSLESAIINRCCGVILCADCGIRGNRLRERDGSVQGKCGYCNRALNAAEDLIFASQNISLQSILAMSIVSETADPSEIESRQGVDSSIIDPPAEPPATPINPKVKSLIDIFRGEIGAGTRVERQYNSVIVGSVDVPCVRPRKVIVYAAYSETFVECCSAADREGIPYLILRSNNSREVLRTFAESTSMILFAKSKTACAGLDLQHATDLVIMHRIASAVETEQIIGRIQRMGRSDNARVHYLLYRNEQ